MQHKGDEQGGGEGEQDEGGDGGGVGHCGGGIAAGWTGGWEVRVAFPSGGGEVELALCMRVGGEERGDAVLGWLFSVGDYVRGARALGE